MPFGSIILPIALRGVRMISDDMHYFQTCVKDGRLALYFRLSGLVESGKQTGTAKLSNQTLVLCCAKTSRLFAFFDFFRCASAVLM